MAGAADDRYSFWLSEALVEPCLIAVLAGDSDTVPVCVVLAIHLRLLPPSFWLVMPDDDGNVVGELVDVGLESLVEQVRVVGDDELLELLGVRPGELLAVRVLTHLFRTLVEVPVEPETVRDWTRLDVRCRGNVLAVFRPVARQVEDLPDDAVVLLNLEDAVGVDPSGFFENFRSSKNCQLQFVAHYPPFSRL